MLISLFICLIPKIFTSIDPDAEKSGGASGVAGILWPLCFMLGFVSSGVVSVLNTAQKESSFLNIWADETKRSWWNEGRIFKLAFFSLLFYEITPLSACDSLICFEIMLIYFRGGGRAPFCAVCFVTNVRCQVVLLPWEFVKMFAIS